MAIAMLTTIDNPYNPFDKFDEWLDYDLLAGHNCCAKSEHRIRKKVVYNYYCNGGTHSHKAIR